MIYFVPNCASVPGNDNPAFQRFQFFDHYRAFPPNNPLHASLSALGSNQFAAFVAFIAGVSQELLELTKGVNKVAVSARAKTTVKAPPEKKPAKTVATKLVKIPPIAPG